MPGYEADDGTERADEAFKRMFERDKAELREMGVPLETGRTSAFDTEDGYRIARAEYELPEITLTGEEAAAVGLALRLWESAQLAGAAHSALVKLRAAGVDVDPQRTLPIQPRLDAGEPAFEACYAAARDRRRVRRSTTGVPTRTPPPAGTSSPGAWSPGTAAGTWWAWTSTGRRRGCSACPGSSAAPPSPGRRAPSHPPAGVDLAAIVARQAGGGEEQLVVVRARPGTAVGLRRSAVPLGAGRRRRRPAAAVHHRALGAGRPAGRLRPRRRRRGADRGARRRRRAADPPGRDGAPAREHAGHDRPDDPAAVAGPYLTARPDGVPLAEVARDFGVPERQLQRDLELLWMCGLPGYGPGDLIDLAFEGDRVRVTFDAGMVRPLRLTTDEAVALIVALRALLELPGLAEQEAVSRALAKVAAAAGHAAEVTPVALSVDTRELALAVVREGLERKRALHLHYYVPTRDERTERTVDPMRLLFVDGRWYLEAWCRRAEGMRLFRLDRVDDVQVLDEPAAPPPQAHERDVENGVYQPEPGRRWSGCGWPGAPAGWPTTTRSSRSPRSTTRPAVSRSPCARPTSPGPGGWSPRSAGPPWSTSRPSSPPRSPPTPAPPCRRYGIDPARR